MPRFLMLLIVIIVLDVILITKGNNARRNRYEVMTESGLVRGQLAMDGDYVSYLGIPYAEPPTGKNRFKPPVKRQPWKGVFKANRVVTCPQKGVGDEDCLILNVFTPNNVTDDLLPVLVYIHGGSYIIGSGQSSGVEPLMKENVIVVTINYRLGALGFLCLGIQEAPGNAGLKDQHAALKWVHENIQNFGGNPNSITVYGMSAGGASVEFQLLSKLNNGLIKNAIIESASTLPVWATDSNPVETAKTMADRLQFTNYTNIYDLLEFYQQVSLNYLTTINYNYYQNLLDGTFGFAPCLEKDLNETDPFLTEDALNILRKGSYNKVPTMFVYSSLEGLFLRSEEYYSLRYAIKMQRKFSDFIPADLQFDSEEIKNEVTNNIRNFYFGNETILENPRTNFLNYFGDYMVMHGLLNSAELHSANSNPVYLMEFAHKGNLGSFEAFYDDLKMAGHGDVIKHVILNKPYINTDEDRLAVDRLSKIITNFMKYGNPIPERSELLPIRWPVVQPNNVSYLYFNKDLEIFEEPMWDRKRFWDSLYSKYRRPLEVIGNSLLFPLRVDDLH